VLYSADLAPFLVIHSANDESLDSSNLNLRLQAEDVEAAFHSLDEKPFAVTELVIIDSAQSGIDDLQQLLRSQFDNQSQIITVELTDDGNAIASVAEILSRYSNLDAVHIISHATEGALQLGDHMIDQSELLANSALVQQWGESLNASGDILLYGCNLSATDDGRGFAKTLSTLTSADVASSSDITGHALRNGNWDLEISEGEIETAVVANAQVQDDWVGSLDINSGLIHHWKLDGNGNDSVGVANINFINSVGSPTGLVDQAADFLESSGSVFKFGESNPGNFNGGFGTSELSIAFWMHANSANPGTTLLGNMLGSSAGYSMSIDANGYLVFTISDGTSQQSVSVADAVADSDWR